MADIVSKSVRSRMMSGIRGKHTKPEIVVRKFLFRKGLRFRLHKGELPGRPDLVFPMHRVAVHVHGCFWHQHRGCRLAYMPSSNRAFWRPKLQGNAKRDLRNARALRALGWRVITIWECETESAVKLENLARKILSK